MPKMNGIEFLNDAALSHTDIVVSAVATSFDALNASCGICYKAQ